MRFLSRFSLRNPVAVVILVLLVAVGGIFSALGLQEDLMPDLSVPVLSIMTTYPGASPSQVAADITTPMEKALNGAQDVETITSTSVANVSQIELQLNMNADLNADEQNVQQIVNQVALPASAGKPAVKSFSFSNTPILQFTVASSKLSSEQLKNVVNNTVVPSLQGVAGVATVNAAGADADNVVVQFDPAKLTQYHLTLAQVLQDLQSNNASLPLGTATANGMVQPVQLNAAFKSLDDIRNLQIGITPSTAGSMQRALGAASGESSLATVSTSLQTIPLSDIAAVSMQPPTDSSINRTNGQPSIMITVTKTENANTVTVAGAINKELNALKGQLPSGVNLIPLFDSSQMVTASVNGMLREAVLGAIFAVLVILLFLRNWLTTLVAVVSIPISILTAIILLSRYGITLNIMTLGGLAVATGRVVDDSIVVIENIYRTWKNGLGFGKKLVLYATGEVGSAILSSTLATIAVFLPLAMVGGMVGKIFVPFALTVVCSLASSLIVALTVVPILAWLFVVRKRAKGVAYDWVDGDRTNGTLHPSLVEFTEVRSESDAFIAAAVDQQPWQKRYQSVLRWCLNHKGWVILGTSIAFVASLAVLPFVGSTFIPNSMQQTATVSIRMPVGTPLDVTNAKADQVEQTLKQDASDIQQINTSVGGGGGGFRSGAAAANAATLDIALNAKTDVNSFLAKVRGQVSSLAGAGTTIQVKGQMTGGGGTSFDIVVNGSNDSAIQQAAAQIVNRLQNFSGLANVQSNVSQTQPEVSIVPDGAQAAKYGLTAQQIAGAVRSYLSQENIGTVNLSGQTYNLNVVLQSSAALNDLAAIRQLPVSTATGQTVPLGDVASVTSLATPTSILHQDGHDYVEITADYTTQNTNRTLQSALRAIKALNLPSGVEVGQSTSAMQQSQSFTQLIEAILVAVGMVYIVMLILFGEWSAPFAILFSMPVALIGAFFGTFIAHEPLSVSSLIGILMLMGIVVTNAIVLVQRVEQQRRLGMTVREALLEAGTTRLRPILMTAVATICALVPLAVGASEGVLISQGLAVVVIGGLITSTILTLCIVPLIYEVLHLRIHRRELKQSAAVEG